MATVLVVVSLDRIGIAHQYHRGVRVALAKAAHHVDHLPQAYAQGQGLFAGASIEGSYIDADNDWNALYYGGGANAKGVILDRRYTNPGAEPLRQYLSKW